MSTTSPARLYALLVGVVLVAAGGFAAYAASAPAHEARAARPAMS